MTHAIQNDPVKGSSQSLLEFQIKICYACFPWWNLGQTARASAAVKTKVGCAMGEPEGGRACCVKALRLRIPLKLRAPWESALSTMGMRSVCHYKCSVLRDSSKPKLPLPSLTLELWSCDSAVLVKKLHVPEAAVLGGVGRPQALERKKPLGDFLVPHHKAHIIFPKTFLLESTWRFFR